MSNQLPPRTKPQTQTELVFNYLMRHGRLTRLTAMLELGVMELSSRVIAIERGELESGVWIVPRVSIKFKSRNGRKGHLTEYHTPVKAIPAEAKFSPCPRCRGRCVIPDPHAPLTQIQCPDCEGEGRVDKCGFPPSYS